MKKVAMTQEIRRAVLSAHEDFVLQTAAGYAAEPYTRALLSVPIGATTFHEDDVSSMIVYLVGNLRTWRGPAAKAAKIILRSV